MGAGVLEVVVGVREAVNGEGGRPGTRGVGRALEGLSAEGHIGAVSWHERCPCVSALHHVSVSVTYTHLIVTTTYVV